MAASYGWLSSALRFAADADSPFFQRSLAVTASRRLGEDFTAEVAAGALLGGAIQSGGVSYSFQPGWLARAGGTWLALDGRGAWPFLAVTVNLAVAGTTTVAAGRSTERYTAVDASLSASAGKVLLGWLTPYLGVKAFGGPVSWTLEGRPVTGTDVDHWQAAVGLAIALPWGLDVTGEWAPLGARSAVAQAGFSF